MQKGKIMLRFFLPAYQDAPKTVHPRVGPLDDPAPGLLFRLQGDRILIPSIDVDPTFRSEASILVNFYR